MQKFSFLFALVTALFIGCTDTASDDFDCGCVPVAAEAVAETAAVTETVAEVPQVESSAATGPVSEAPAAAAAAAN